MSLQNNKTFDNPIMVKLANNDSTTTNAVGNFILDETIALNYILWLKSFDVILISKAKLTKDLNYSLTFYHNYCIIQDNLNGSIGMGYKECGLYIFSTKDNRLQGEDCFQARSNLAIVPARIWHNKLEYFLNDKLNILNIIDKIQ